MSSLSFFLILTICTTFQSVVNTISPSPPAKLFMHEWVGASFTLDLGRPRVVRAVEFRVDMIRVNSEFDVRVTGRTDFEFNGFCHMRAITNIVPSPVRAVVSFP